MLYNWEESYNQANIIIYTMHSEHEGGQRGREPQLAGSAGRAQVVSHDDK